MFKPRLLFGVPSSIKDPSSGLVLPNKRAESGGPQLLSPGLVSAETLSRMTDVRNGIKGYAPCSKSCTVYFPFPTRSMNPRNKYNYSSVGWMPTNRDYVDKHQFLEIEQFDFDKIKSIHDFVKAKDSLSFVMSDMKAADLFVKDFRIKVNKVFPVNSTMKWESKSSMAISDPLLVVTFLDMPLCIPIYNPKHNSGMGMMIALLDKKSLFNSGLSSRLYTAAEINLVVADSKINLLTVDGVRLGNNRVPGDDLVRNLRGHIQKQSSTPKKGAAGSPSPEKKESKGVIGGFAKPDYVKYTKYTTTISTTSSTSN